jgi:GntR family transcriptional regulator/MocR family aminotransferase
MVAPDAFVADLVRQRAFLDAGSPTIDQLVCARMLRDAAYDRHLRAARRRYRARRDALVEALRRHLPEASLSGLAAGLYATATVPGEVEASMLVAAASRRSVAIYPVTAEWSGGDRVPAPRRSSHEPRPLRIVLGYANLSEAAIAEGVRRLAAALAEIRGAPAGAQTAAPSSSE